MPAYLLEPVQLARAGKDELQQTIQIFPKGPNLQTVDGRSFKISDPQKLADRINERASAAPILVDYDHLSAFDPDDGGSSKAAGWIDRVEVRDGEIWAVVTWTVTAAEAIANGEYRFISPEFSAVKTSTEVFSLDAVALVNRPAFSMKALAAKNSNSTNPPDGDEPMLKAIAKELGLPEDATEAQILAAMRQRNQDHETALASAKAAAKTPSVDDFMPRADYDKVLARAESAEANLKKQSQAAFTEKVTASIDKAVADGKITPGSKEHYTALCTDEDQLAKVMAAVGSAPAVIQTTPITGKPSDGADALTDAQKEMCRSTGVSENDFKKQLAAERAA